jgi:hypothetical protein
MHSKYYLRVQELFEKTCILEKTLTLVYAPWDVRVLLKTSVSKQLDQVHQDVKLLSCAMLWGFYKVSNERVGT